MIDIIERLRRYAGGMCISTSAEIEAADIIEGLRADLETERMRLAACGVVALANTPDSAKQAREMRPEYWSASCGDVARMVDENIKLRARIEAMEKQEPIGWFARLDGDGPLMECKHTDIQRVPLYALPGAKGEEK